MDTELRSVIERDQLERGFRRLSVEQRTVVVLHHLADMPLEQVAEVTGVPEGTVHSRLYRALSALRAALEADARAPSSIYEHREVAR
ncbi:MAG: sigma-70 family RNA polymerase sigma factor [Chloroflexota bacterium]